MGNEQMNECVQRVLDSRIQGLSNISDIGQGKIGKYKYNTALRLIKFIYKYREGKITQDDLLVSLRNYLLVLKTSLILPEDIDITDNHYGLELDGEMRCYAVLNIPEYLNEGIVSQGFMRDYIEVQETEKYFLGVTPNIYRLTGFKYFKSIRQKLAVNGVLNMSDGYTALVSLPTGGGKSLITQTLAYQKDSGLTITVVPTVSLALDQVRVAKENIKISKENEIVCYYSNLNQADKKRILDGIKHKTLRLLFISPEALIKNEIFRKAIEEANVIGYLKNIVIDEAHIVIEWGSFFRIDYQCLEPWRNTLIQSNLKLKTVLLSATFEKNTVNILKSMFSQQGKWIEIRCDALRKEPRFGLIKATSWYDKNKKTERLLQCLPRPMIVYVATPDQAERVSERARSIGITNFEIFTGKTKSAERERIIRDWASNEIDLIIATSAFGIGVDKGDVRTVLHLYVPDNPNAYYQELGRGGRDGLPCLSIMCIYPTEDFDFAFAMTEKVPGADKILGRWDSMLNSSTAKWVQGSYTLDMSVKPKYNYIKGSAEAASKLDQQWNIYVILLLRRYGMITILDMVVEPESQRYLIRVKLNDERLLQITDETEKLIICIRDTERKKNEKDFKLIQKAIFTGENDCWSEMFFHTYDRVSEYCAGCGRHTQVIETEKNRFELVKKVACPIKEHSTEALFAETKEGLLIVSLDDYHVINSVIKKGIHIILFDEEFTDRYMNLLLTMQANADVRIMGFKEYLQLVEHGDLYYTSGDAIALYEDGLKDAYKKLTSIRRASEDGRTRILHIFETNLYFSEIGKSVAELIEGVYLESYLLERM